MKLPKDFREFIELLNCHGARYLLVGGWAVAWHGFPRFTGDMDVFVEVSETNAAALSRVLRDFGFGACRFAFSDLQEPDTAIQLGKPPRRIDLMTAATGLSFADAWERRITTEIDGVTLQMLSRADLIHNKRMIGRLQDMADLERLQATADE